MALTLLQDPNADTEWNDALRRHGIIPEKEKEVTEDDIISLVEQTVQQKSAGKVPVVQTDRQTVKEIDTGTHSFICPFLLFVCLVPTHLLLLLLLLKKKMEKHPHPLAISGKTLVELNRFIIHGNKTTKNQKLFCPAYIPTIFFWS